MNTIYFYKDRPLFGMDIGTRNLRVLEMSASDKQPSVNGWGSIDFDEKAIKDGVIVDPVIIAKAADELFKAKLRGSITSRRVALAIPAAKTFSRAIKLPALDASDIREAVLLEAEQYIPIPIDNLYVDYEMIRQTKDEMELFAVAAPKPLVDSYLGLAKLLGLEPVVIETSIDSARRLFQTVDKNDTPTVLVDFGHATADITILDKTIIATGTVGGGGDNFTAQISSQLGVTPQEAHVIKTKYGLNFSKKQHEISQALSPLLDKLFKEIRRMIRYYEERYGSARGVSQIVLLGGGTDIPGLADRMTDTLRLPVRTIDPWRYFNVAGELEMSSDEQGALLTAAGLALINQRELFA